MNVYDFEYNRNKEIAIKELERIDNKIDERKRQIERLEKKRSKVYDSFSWHENVVERLMHDLEEVTGLHGEIYGPFGLRAATSIYLREDMSKGICEQMTLSIELEHRKNRTYYFTGECTHDYEPMSIGYLNGFNHVMAPLPDTLVEIVKLLTRTEAHQKEA